MLETVAVSSSSGSTANPWCVAVFAYNEERNIISCLDSLHSAAPMRKLEVFVLANGCTDRTEQIVRDYAHDNLSINLICIKVPDKANAWNHYVHKVAKESDVHFFIDGDVKACPESFIRLHDTIIQHPNAHAAAAFPTTGRSLKKWRRMMLEEAWLAGNLYALRGTFINRIRLNGIRLPLGWIIEDGLVGALAKWDLDPTGSWDSSRIIACPEAGFSFRSMVWYRLDDWHRYWRRRVRYSIGFYQNKMIRLFIKTQGIKGMPETVQDLYQKTQEHFSVRKDLNIVFDWVALNRIRKDKDNSSI